MSILTTFQTTGLSIIARTPLVRTGSVSRILTGKVSSYGHESRAIGGYWSAGISLDDNDYMISDWIQNGLGRHTETRNPAGVIIWEGFVNKINAKLGPLDFTIGPLIGSEMANKIKVAYSTTDTSTTPPTVGIREVTAFDSNTDSQDLYGIIEKVVSLQGTYADVGAQTRDKFLLERAFPTTSRDSNLTGASGPSITLDCLGYWHWLKAYLYNSTTTGDMNLSDKMIAILGASPNALFSSDYSRVVENTTQVAAWEDEDRTAETILTGLVGVGDANLNRYNVGFYAGRQFIYEVAPDEVFYQQRISSNIGITTKAGRIVDPWDVNPAEWLLYPDFLVGRFPPITSATLQSDPRAGFIETVKFDAPYGLSINGEKIGQYDQLLQRIGLAGTAV